MDLHVEVAGEPLVEVVRVVGGPEDGAVEHAAVLEGIGQAGDIHATALAVFVHRHLDLFVLLNQDGGAFQGVDAVHPLAKVHLLGAVGQDEVVGMGIPVIFVIAQGEAGLLLHAQGAGQLEVVALVLVAGGLAHADKAAAIPNEAANGDVAVLPGRAASMGGVAVAHVDDHIDVVQNLGVGLDVIKADEAHIEGGAGQGLDHAGIRIILLLVNRVVDHVTTPGALLTPAVEHGHGLHAVGGGPLDILP